MKNLPQPIQFNHINNCPIDDNYCQLVDSLTFAKFRLSRLCDNELLGTTIKQPCESYISIPDMSSVFTDLTGMLATDIKVYGTGSGTHIAKTATSYLISGTTYIINYQMRGLTSGNFKIIVGDNSSAFHTANGYYTEVINSGATTKLQLVGVDGDTDFDGIFANITIRCIRYSNLFSFDWSTGEGLFDPFTFSGQTKICVHPGPLQTSSMSKLVEGLTPGYKYKLSFRITDNSCNSLIKAKLWSTTFTDSNALNGWQEIYLTCGDGIDNKNLVIDFSDSFCGCIQDITLFQTADIRVGVFNSDGSPSSCSEIDLTSFEEGSDSSVITLSSNSSGHECKCVKIGYADSCDDYLSQFSLSNIIKDNTTRLLSLNINIDGTFVIPISAPISVTEYDITYKNIIAKEGICYNGVLKYELIGDGIQQVDIHTIIGGIDYLVGSIINPPSGTYEPGFSGLISGGLNNDIKFYFIITGSITGATSGKFFFADFSTTLCDGQFFPDHFSNCFSIVNLVECTDILNIKYSNIKPAFGLVYDNNLPEYTLLIRGKLWHPDFKKVREVNRGSTGHKTINYSDIQAPLTLSTERLPEYIIEALSVALDHDTFEIDGQLLVNEGDELTPNWNKNDEMAAITCHLTKQNTRIVKSYC